MHFELSEEQRLIADTVSAVTRKTDPAWVWEEMVNAGLIGMTFSEEQGGAGIDLMTLWPAVAELGRAPVQPPFIACALLPGLLASRCEIPNFDPSAVIDNRVRSTVALPDNASTLVISDGQISGSVQQVTGGKDADLLLLCVENSEGAVCTVVDLNSPQVTRTETCLIDGQNVADIFIEEIQVVWSKESKELSGWMSDVGAFLQCTVALGAARAMCDLTRDYISTREQFGQAIGRFQVLQHQMVDVFHDIEHFSSLVMAAADACDGSDTTSRQKTVSALKRFCGTRVRAAAAASIQMHGGIGVTEEYDLSYYVKRILLADMLYGTADDHAARLGQLVAVQARDEFKSFEQELSQ